MNRNNNIKSILIIAANPVNQPPLSLLREIREIKEGLILSGYQGKIETVEASRPKDIQIAILKNQPDIIHFSHGSRFKDLSFEDEYGYEQLVDFSSLVEFFKIYCKNENNKTIKCVFFNSCFSSFLSKEINKYIKYSIGFDGKLNDEIAILFARGFYEKVHMIPIHNAYRYALNYLQINGINYQPYYVLYENKSIDTIVEKNDELVTNNEQNINYDDYGKQDSDNFRKVYKFDAPPRLRKAIYNCHKNSKKLNPDFFKICKLNNYLDIENNTGELEVVYSKSNKIMFQCINLFEIIIFLFISILLVLTIYVSWMFFSLAVVLMICLCFGTQPYTRPYRLAKRIESEIKEMN